MANIGKVNTEIKAGIASICFSHPQSNSLPGTLLRSLASEITLAGENPEAKVIIIKSEGDKTFCAGASFDELASISNMDEGTRFFSGFAGVINAIRKAPKFVLVRVQGKAVGGGVGIACAGDYTLATDTASVKLSELAVGIGPFVVGPAVERKIGTSAFTQLTINASQWHSAHWAKERGMFAHIYNSIEEMDAGMNDLATMLAGSNPEAMMMLKNIMWESASHWDKLLAERAEMSGKLVLSDFTRNAIARFKQGAR